MLKWQVGQKQLQRGTIPLLMGILNVTPDSFSDGGQFKAIDSALAHAESLIAEGADLIDIGGESTRPGAEPVTTEEELRRTIPVVRKLAGQTDIPISIDTTKAEVARQAIDAGAVIVNDVSGLTFDPEMSEVCGRSGASVCVMHIKGRPQTMQDAPVYDNVVAEVTRFLERNVSRCLDAGVTRDRICIDPGIGFGKTAEHNLILMKRIREISAELQCPILVGHSRKRFLSKLLGRTVDERTFGTIGVCIALAENGADILRIHDVKACRDALIAWQAVRSEAV